MDITYQQETRSLVLGFPLCAFEVASYLCCERTSIKENQLAHGLQENVEQPNLRRTEIIRGGEQLEPGDARSR